ncbi:hypothetical protein BHE74_00009900 [Ensete ventricosum]|nr:hypothetical protein BHE74_00009900 [Ensete ventricosum]
MFHNPGDVRWFKASVAVKTVDKWRYGPNAVAVVASKNLLVPMQHDTVCMSLYKRAYPKWPEQCYPWGDTISQSGMVSE